MAPLDDLGEDVEGAGSKTGGFPTLRGKNYIPNLFILQRKINGRNVEAREYFGVDL